MTDAQFTALTTKYIDTVYRVALNWMKHPSDAEDITQTVFLKLYREEKAFASEAYVKHWLLRVTINECKRTVRSPFRKAEPLEDHANRLHFDAPGHSDLYDAVMGLPRKYRVPILLYYYEGYSTAEISGLLLIPVSTVATRLRRGREQLKEKLQEEIYYAE